MPSTNHRVSKVASRVPSLVLVLALCSTLAAAQGHLSKEFTPAEHDSSYWTAERMREARPMPLPRVDPLVSEGQPSRQALGRGPSIEGAAAPPARALRSEDAVQLFEMTGDDAEIAAAWAALEAAEAGEAAGALGAGDGRENVGSARAHFSSSRVFPDVTTTTYPYIAVGKLFFSQPGVGNFVCSAAVISKRLVLTAGHCVHKGSGGTNGFFTNFQFVPAFRNGAAPAGTWNPIYVVVSGAWANGNGNVPNAGDFAVFEMIDQGGQRISFFTGHFGYQTQKLFPNHVTLVGYPVNHDSGNRMHQVAAQSFKKLAPNTVQYGSDMRGGSSGGPWVQNLGEAAVGQTGGTNSAANRVVGVTSYGPTAVGPLYQGSSVLDNNFANNAKTGVFDTVCKHRAGNCT